MSTAPVDSIIYLGPQKDYIFRSSSLNHILKGDLSHRHDKINGKTLLTKILKGGLHTLEGWQEFVENRPDIKHGLFYDPETAQDWYFIRELRNGVMLLKMPRSAFQNNAAYLTRKAEDYLKSGYLWKTLFPKNFREADIVSAIDEAIENQDIEETTPNYIIGYTKSDDPFKVLKIRVQLRGKEILSAFPTWGQPMTGNEGKPYSPTEALRVIVAASTLFTEQDQVRINNLTFSFDMRTVLELFKNTPGFLLSRPRVDMTQQRGKQRIRRNKELSKIASTLIGDRLEQAYSLAMSDIYLRYPFLFLRQIYLHHYVAAVNTIEMKNALAIYQNLRELIIVLAYRDKADGTQLAFNVIRRLFKVHFIFTGGIDQWEMNRLWHVIADIVVDYNNPALSREFLELLNISPLRIAIFTDFNVYPLFDPNPAIICLTGIPKPLNMNHFYEFVVQQLGVNYTYNFDEAFNRKKAIEAQTDIGPYGLDLARDQVMHSLAEDFFFFTPHFSNICKILKIDKETISLIEEILLAYKRCVAVNIQRILIKYSDLFSKREEEYEFMSPEHISFVHAKHEHKVLRQFMNMALEEFSKQFIHAGFKKEGDELYEKFGWLLKEAGGLPMPKSVPDGLVGSATTDDFVDENPPHIGEKRSYKIKLDN